jgi:hypothetical protein
MVKEGKAACKLENEVGVSVEFYAAFVLDLV